MSEVAEIAESSKADEVEENLYAMIPARLRSDLVIKKQRFKNKDYFVIKDPLALTYQRLGTEEAYLVSLLDGKRSIRTILEEFKKGYPNWEMSPREAAAFVNQLGNNGLLNINARKFVEFARGSKQQPNSILALWGKVMSKLIFLKIPLVDPSPWLGKLTAKFGWVWTRPFIGGCICFFAWTIFWLFANRQEFANNNISFFSPQNLGLLWFQIIFIKTLHEFGHAMTSRHFGAEVHEMGLCMICFTPCGYVDATDAYMMKYRRHKIYTVIAGIFIEFIIASIAAHIWLYSGPGLVKNLAFNAMLVASINTLFFNMNPLMKFDGYYVISDLLEIPNLRTKSIAYCSYSFQKIFLGIRNLMLEPIFEEDSNSRVFLLYAIAAFTYMGFIIISLSQIFARVLTPYGLGQFGSGDRNVCSIFFYRLSHCKSILRRFRSLIEASHRTNRTCAKNTHQTNSTNRDYRRDHTRNTQPLRSRASGSRHLRQYRNRFDKCGRDVEQYPIRHRRLDRRRTSHRDFEQPQGRD